MKSAKIFLLSISLLLLNSCKKYEKTVLVSGDSWATFVCIYKSLNKSLEKQGVSNAGANVDCPLTTRTGVRADEWLSSKYHDATLASLKDRSVKVLYLSLGGNDFLNYWNKNMSGAEETALFDAITQNVVNTIQSYREARPDIKILVSGYDFPHFSVDHPIKVYRDAFEDMGQPTPVELNSAILRFSKRVSNVVSLPGTFFIQHYGLMHYYFGNPSQGLSPRTTLLPEQISAADNINQYGGAIEFQTDTEALLNTQNMGINVFDAFHLSKKGYEYLGDHVVTVYLKHWL